MFERPPSGERAVLVHLEGILPHGASDLDEFRQLADAAGALAEDLVIGSGRKPDPGLLVGKGKAEEIRAAVITPSRPAKSATSSGCSSVASWTGPA